VVSFGCLHRATLGILRSTFATPDNSGFPGDIRMRSSVRASLIGGLPQADLLVIFSALKIAAKRDRL
jgi:hypothetical protein